jgi:hypothetical protein
MVTVSTVISNDDALGSSAIVTVPGDALEPATDPTDHEVLCCESHESVHRVDRVDAERRHHHVVRDPTVIACGIGS